MYSYIVLFYLLKLLTISIKTNYNIKYEIYVYSTLFIVLFGLGNTLVSSSKCTHYKVT